MRLVIDGKSLDSVVFSSVLNLPAQDITDRPKTTKDEQGNFVPKVDSQGRQAYRVDASAIAHDSSGSPYIDKTVSLSKLYRNSHHPPAPSASLSPQPPSSSAPQQHGPD